MPGKMERSIRREIKWRRFSRFCNSSSQEVYIYGKMRHAMPDWVRACMPPVCERVFHHKYGWGVLETLYLNPDGSAVARSPASRTSKRRPLSIRRCGIS